MTRCGCSPIPGIHPRRGHPGCQSIPTLSMSVKAESGIRGPPVHPCTTQGPRRIRRSHR
jgi:hypothetical protein